MTRVSIAPRSMSARMPSRPSVSIASCRQLSIVSRTSGWSGITIGPVTLSAHATCAGKTAASRSSARMRWSGMGTRRPPWKRRRASARVAFHRQRLANMGAASGLDQVLDEPLAADHVEHAVEREAVLRAEREDEAVVGGRGLQLEVERHAEALAQGVSPGAVQAPAEGRVHDELHPPGLVAEAVGDDAAVRGQRAEDRLPLGEVTDDLLGAVGREPALGGEPLDGRAPIAEPRAHFIAQR